MIHAPQRLTNDVHHQRGAGHRHPGIALYQLTGLERGKIVDDYKELLKRSPI